ncbi:MAG: serine/threonine-protein kinase, partial [Bryobacteraceae bacterium]
MRSIGKYEVFEQIGSGSMGTIFRARDRMLDRPVALKTLRTSRDLDPELKERFYREAQACARLQHPRIVRIYDLNESEGTVYIAMELLAGVDFKRHIDERRSLPMGQKLELMAQVCEALQCAHEQKLVHRDIKPSNLFLCQDQTAKMLDFGIAKLPASRLTIAGKVLGTPNYMAPEQILGSACDSRSDVFSAALVFAEFLVNQHPFADKFIPSRISKTPPDSVRLVDPDVPPAL